MSNEEPKWNLDEPQRQSMLGVVVYIIRNFRVMITLFLSLIAVSISNVNFGLIAVSVLVPASILFTILAYYQHRNFTFHIEDDDLIIHQGVFVKDRIVVSVDRIQSIQITANVVQRILGLVALKVDTAGSKGNELEIPALERDRADALKALLYTKKRETEKVEEGKATIGFAEESGIILVRLNLLDLLKVGLTENHLKTGMVALAFVMGTVSQYQDFLLDNFDQSIDEYTIQAVDAGVKVVIGFVVLYTIFSILLSIGRTVLRFYGLKASLNKDTIDISTGLLKKNHFRVPVSKIQFIEWSNNPLRRAVGYESAKLKPSNSIGEAAKHQKIEIPALQTDKSQLLLKGVFGNFEPPKQEVGINSMAYARFAALISGILFATASAVIYWKFQWYASIPLGIWAAIIAYSYFYGRSVKLSFSDDFIVIRKGFLFKERIVIPTFKIQSLSLLENVFLKRRKLNHLRFYTAAGSKRVKYISDTEAQALYDHLLKRVEQSTSPWM